MKSNADIVNACNELARKFYSQLGYKTRKGYKFHEASHPQEISCWNMAVMAYEHIESTDVEDALNALEETGNG